MKIMNIKKKAITVLAIIALFFMAFASALEMNSVFGSTQENVVDSNYAQMINGAFIRYLDDEKNAGIRFGFVMGEDYYNGLMEDTTKTEVKVTSKITDANNDSRPAIEVNWVLKTSEGNAEEINFKNNKETGAKEVTFYHTINFGILFDGEHIVEACAIDLKAEMDLVVNNKVEVDGGEVIRSARSVANAACELGKELPDYKPDELAKYYGTRVDLTEDVYFDEIKITTNVTDGVMTATEKKTENLNLVFANDTNLGSFDISNYSMYENYVDKKENVTAADFSTLGETKDVNYTMFDVNNNVINIKKAMYVTKALTKEGDTKVFDVFDNDGVASTLNNSRKVEGYYVLANDITNDLTVDSSNRHEGLSRSWVQQREEEVNEIMSVPNETTGFHGTFDGQGHTLAVDVYGAGIFGVLQKDSIIKNTKFDVTFTNQNFTAAAVLAYEFGKNANPNNETTAIQFNDLYIHIADFRTALNSSKTAGLVYKGSQGFVFKNVIIEIDNHKLVSTKDKYDGLPYIGATEMNAQSDWTGFVNGKYTNNETLGSYSTYDEYIKAYRGEFGRNERIAFRSTNTVLSGAIFAIHDPQGAGLDWYYRGLYVISNGAIMAAMTDTWNRNLTLPDGWFLCSYVVFGDDATLVSGTDYVLNENFDNQGNTFTGDKATAKGHACLKNYVLKRPRRYNSKTALKDANNSKIGHWAITEDSIVWAN